MRVLAALFTAACSVGEVPIEGGGPDGGGNGNNNGTGGGQSFNAVIKPLVTECTACHSTTTPPNLSSFSALEPKFKMKPGAQNSLVLKGTHYAVPYFTPEEITTVTMWIDSL